MTASVTIGEFSRLTHLTIKSLRHYHDQGLLIPYAVDAPSGYRRYAIDQVPDAMLIGRLRALDMPLAEVRRVIETRPARGAGRRDRRAPVPDGTRARPHPGDRRLTARPAPPGGSTRPSPARCSTRWWRRRDTEHVGRTEIGAWCAETFTSLYTDLLTDAGEPVGPGGAFYGEEFFTEAAGDVTAYVPVRLPGLRAHAPSPGGTYAIAVHAGPFVDFDLTYAALGIPRRRARQPQARARSGRSTWSARPTPPTKPATAPKSAGRSPPDRSPLKRSSPSMINISLGQIVIDSANAAAAGHLLQPVARPATRRRRQPVLRRRPACARRQPARP